MPCVLVSCKCDRSPDSRQLDPRIIEQISTSFGPGNGGIDSFQTSANLPESQKRCISVILRTIISNRSGWSRFTEYAVVITLTWSSSRTHSQTQPSCLEWRCGLTRTRGLLACTARVYLLPFKTIPLHGNSSSSKEVCRVDASIIS